MHHMVVPKHRGADAHLFFKEPGKILGIYKTIRDKDPQQLKFEFALWTRQMIIDLIKRQFNIKIRPASVGRLLRQLGFTCQKPPYSPDLNPIEQLWNHAKGNGVGRKTIHGPDQLKKSVINKLRSLQKLPKKIASLFRLPAGKQLKIGQISISKIE